MFATLKRLMTGREADAAPVLPRQGTTSGALVLVMTIMSFLACLAIWATLSIADATRAWTEGIANSITVQLKPPEDGPVPASDVEAALEVLRAAPGILEARALSNEETAALLEPFIGRIDGNSELPVPVLIAVSLGDRAAIDLEQLNADLTQAVPFAVLDDHTRWTANLFAVSRSLLAIALTVLALVLLAATAIIVFATRAGLLTHQGIVEILHLSGARDAFIAREFQNHFLFLGLRAGMTGLALAILIIFAVALFSGSEEETVGLLPTLTLRPLSILLLLVVPIGGAIIATVTARTTVLAALRRLA